MKSFDLLKQCEQNSLVLNLTIYGLFSQDAQIRGKRRNRRLFRSGLHGEDSWLGLNGACAKRFWSPGNSLASQKEKGYQRMLACFACALTLRPSPIPSPVSDPCESSPARYRHWLKATPALVKQAHFFTFTVLLQESPTSCVDTHVGLWVKCTLTSLVNVEKELKFSLSLLCE